MEKDASACTGTSLVGSRLPFKESRACARGATETRDGKPMCGGHAEKYDRDLEESQRIARGEAREYEVGIWVRGNIKVTAVNPATAERIAREELRHLIAPLGLYVHDTRAKKGKT